MSELSVTAAYILTNHGVPRDQRHVQSDFDEELARLLRTPHTVQSLTKAITHDNRADAQSNEQHIKARLQTWLDEGMIQLSPDS